MSETRLPEPNQALVTMRRELAPEAFAAWREFRTSVS
jgi:hypothetical protein